MTTTAQGELILAKTLRDKRVIEIRIIPRGGKPDSISHELVIHWPGTTGQPFSTRPFKPETAPAPGVTHAIRIPGPDGKWVNLGLTAAEAAQVSDGTAAWARARQDARDAEQTRIARAARDAAPGAETWTVTDGYGYLAEVGGTVRLSDGTAVTVLSHSSRYFSEDGYSYGAAEDAGTAYYTEVREATPAEVAGLEAREARAAAREQLAAAGTALASDPAAEFPENVPGDLRALPGARIEPERHTLAFGSEGCYRHLRMDENTGALWVLTHNDPAGADWSLSNCGSYIARRLPLTPERRALFGDLVTEFGGIAVRNG